MRRRTIRPPRHPLQIELFASTDASSVPAMPEWRSLPQETRQTLTDLIARLILDHAAGEGVGRDEEARHDI